MNASNVLYIVLFIILVVVIALIATKKINLGGGIDDEIDQYKTSTSRDVIDRYFSVVLKNMVIIESYFKYAILWSKDQTKTKFVEPNVRFAVNRLNYIMGFMELISYKYKTYIGTVMAKYYEEPPFNEWSIDDIVSNTKKLTVGARFEMLIEKFAYLFFKLKLRLLEVNRKLMSGDNRLVEISQEVESEFSLIYEKIQKLHDVFKQNVET